jgi:hypothetical protein
VFCLVFFFSGALAPSLIIGRFFAGAFNFYTAKWVVFKSSGNILRELTLYISLVAVLTCLSYFLIDSIVAFGIPLLLGKIIVETVIFLVAFSIQRTFVFSDTPSVTDWDVYYKNRKFSINLRYITEKLLLRILGRLSGKEISSITEFGGGDSCFYEALAKAFPQAKYTIVDNSEAGVALFLRKYTGENIAALKADILCPISIHKAEIVFSVGLIEHFPPEDTERCIAAHFDAVWPGGLVLISYPTPTIPYRIIRSLAEMLHIWRFHDERPLSSDEVVPQMAKYGTIVHQSKNWWIGLTQEVVAVRAR